MCFSNITSSIIPHSKGRGYSETFYKKVHNLMTAILVGITSEWIFSSLWFFPFATNYTYSMCTLFSLKIQLFLIFLTLFHSPVVVHNPHRKTDNWCTCSVPLSLRHLCNLYYKLYVLCITVEEIFKQFT